MIVLYILLALAVLLAAFLIWVAMKPGEFQVTRQQSMAAPASVVFPLVNNLRMWPLWSPWDKLDPEMQKTYEGSDEGTGASYAWNGNKKAGQGRMTIIDSKQDKMVGMRLDFISPFPCSNDVKFTFKPEGNGTLVNWKMTGTNGFMGKLFCTFMNMDKMVGTDFEKGLTAMKAVAEKKA